jgi:hypothetical protein
VPGHYGPTPPCVLPSTWGVPNDHGNAGGVARYQDRIMGR